MLKIDLHTHTVATKHAFNTINEMAEEAARRGVEILGITDHGPSLLDGASQDYFGVGRRLPKEINGVRILFGVEANIINGQGELDISEKLQKSLDIVLAGLHQTPDYIDLGRDGNTEAIIKAMENPYVKIIAHPYNLGNNLDVDMEKIALAACERDILLEVNSSYFYVVGRTNGEETQERMKRMIAILKKHGKKTIITSDAHMIYDIGRDEEVREKFGYLGLTDSDILNYDLEATKEYFNIK